MRCDCTIVIPAYNAINTFCRCIKSLQLDEEILSNCEIIIVDDGSVDNTSILLTEFAYRYPSVIVVDKFNNGVSSARNVGIDLSYSRFIYFMDSDDKINAYVLSKMIEKMKTSSSDCLISNYEKVSNTNNSITKVELEIPSNSLLDRKYIENNILIKYYTENSFSSTCYIIYNLDILLKNSIRFNEYLAHAEDWEFNIKFFCVAQSAYAIEDILYSVYSYTDSGLEKYKDSFLPSLVNGICLLEKVRQQFKIIPCDSSEYVLWVKSFLDNVKWLLEYKELLPGLSEKVCDNRQAQIMLQRAISLSGKQRKEYGITAFDIIVALLLKFRLLAIARMAVLIQY